MVDLPLWKIWVSWDYDIPNMETKTCSKPPTKYITLYNHHIPIVLGSKTLWKPLFSPPLLTITITQWSYDTMYIHQPVQWFPPPLTQISCTGVLSAERRLLVRRKHGRHMGISIAKFRFQVQKVGFHRHGTHLVTLFEGFFLGKCKKPWAVEWVNITGLIPPGWYQPMSIEGEIPVAKDGKSSFCFAK